LSWSGAFTPSAVGLDGALAVLAADHDDAVAAALLAGTTIAWSSTAATNRSRDRILADFTAFFALGFASSAFSWPSLSIHRTRAHRCRGLLLRLLLLGRLLAESRT